MDTKDKKQYIHLMLALFGAAALSIVFFFIIYRYEGFRNIIRKLIDILNPILYGAFIAYLLKPMCNFYENLLLNVMPMHAKAIKILSVTASIISALLFVALLLLIIMPQVIDSIIALINIVPKQLESFSTWIENFIEEDTIYSQYVLETYEETKIIVNNWLKNISSVLKFFEEFGVQIWNSVKFVKNIFIGIIAAVYMLLARRRFARQCKMMLFSIFKTKWANIILGEIRYADSMFVGFINGKLLDSAIIGVICYICSLIFKFPNAMLISVIVGVTNVNPFFGPFIGGIPAGILILIVSPIKALWFALFIIVLQQVDGNIIGPKILGESTGVSSVWVLISILVFGGLWGFVGIIIGVPLFAVLYDITRKLVVYGLKKKGREDLIIKDR